MAARGDPAADRGLQRQESRDSAPPQPAAGIRHASALDLADELAGSIPNRKPGTPGSRRAAKWVASKFELEGFTPSVDHFSADIPGKVGPALERGRHRARAAPGGDRGHGASRRHGDGPGANDNASGTAGAARAARAYASLGAGSGASPGAGPAHNIIFLSTDGGSYGALGATALPCTRPTGTACWRSSTSTRSPERTPRRSSSPATRRARHPPRSYKRLSRLKGADPRAELRHPGFLAQLIDLGFPFNLYEQAPLVGARYLRRDPDNRRKPAHERARPTPLTASRSAGWGRWAARRSCCSARSTRASS